MDNENFKKVVIGVAKVISEMDTDLIHSESNFRNQQRVNTQIKLYAEKLEKLIIDSPVLNDQDKQFLADVKRGKARPPFTWG